jgi:hypothetical protein
MEDDVKRIGKTSGSELFPLGEELRPACKEFLME